jgi:1,2-dihydroxy-3-keto-5-methylthiopentene dioxygenase
MARLIPLWTLDPVTDPEAMAAVLGPQGIEHARWELPEEARALGARSRLSDEDKSRLLALFGTHLDRAAANRGYADADVVAIRSDLPGVEVALAKFDRVHYHDDDEVRAIVGGGGVFGFVGDDGRQFLLEVEAGDYLRVPPGIWHWFYCHADRNITALRLFRDTSGWVPHYRATERGIPSAGGA